ncbi:MAG: long-chain fatty acid--CoA ligase [Chloroflexaceae bacterium]|nr:long-chain fatty acid--CoA ligase [Chloroflexaceae bacterium]
MLLPPLSNKEQLSELKPLPTFCQYRLTVHYPEQKIVPEDAWNPAHFLNITVNPNYQSESPQGHDLGAKLYLRTSGSMGASKIVVHSHTRLFQNTHNCVERFQLKHTDRVTIAVPIFHMYGLGAGFLPSIIAGASIDLQENTNLLKYLEHERRFDPNAAFLTPALCDMLLQRRGGERRYQVAVSAGARLKAELVYAFDERFGSLVNLYGSTELGAISAASPDDTVVTRATTIGRPMTGVTMLPAAQLPSTTNASEPPESVFQTPEPVMDELYCHHPWGFEAYIDDHGATISQAETWFKTGDLATFNPDGSLRILGRADNSVNRDGYLVLLSDIERVIENIEAVAQVVALATRTENQRGQYLIACCVLKPEMHLDGAAIRTACFDRLPRYAIPDEVLVMDALPTLPSGKVDRQALVAQATLTGVSPP